MTDADQVVKALQVRKLYWEVLGEPCGVVPSAGSLAAWIAVVQHITDAPADTRYPRIWERSEYIPADVNVILLASGEHAYRMREQDVGTWSYFEDRDAETGWDCFFDEELPVTEVVE